MEIVKDAKLIMERQTVIDNDAEAAVRQMTARAMDAENDRATIYDIRTLMGQKDGGSSVRNQRKLPKKPSLRD
ncbi:MAG: hypothetical protein ACLVJX_00245 [Merdibacter sp.]